MFLGLGLLFHSVGPEFRVIGDLPKAELEQVVAIAKDEFRDEVFGRVTWRSIGQVSHGLREYLDHGTVVITVLSESTVEVLIATHEGRIAGRSYMINRTAFGWQIGSKRRWGR